jgi:hypothetical protein
MDTVDVEARSGQDGKIMPLRFTWQGRTYAVESTGRRWQVQEDTHILVMISGNRVVELIFNPGEHRWYLKSIGGKYSLA